MTTNAGPPEIPQDTTGAVDQTEVKGKPPIPPPEQGKKKRRDKQGMDKRVVEAQGKKTDPGSHQVTQPIPAAIEIKPGQVEAEMRRISVRGHGGDEKLGRGGQEDDRHKRRQGLLRPEPAGHGGNEHQAQPRQAGPVKDSTPKARKPVRSASIDGKVSTDPGAFLGIKYCENGRQGLAELSQLEGQKGLDLAGQKDLCLKPGQVLIIAQWKTVQNQVVPKPG